MHSFNKHPVLRLCAFAICLAPMSVSCAFADGAIPIVSPDSHNVVRFTYSPLTIFHVKTRPHMITDLRLAPGEVMETLVLGNTDQWITADAPGNVFLKPTQAGLETSGTLVTNLHTYQLLITSSKNNDWYQQVSWMSGPMVALKSSLSNDAPPAPMPAPTQAANASNHASQNTHDGQAENIKDMSNLHFDYRVRGDAPFKPTEVFDNGTFTWISVPLSGNAPMPALFVKEHGQYAIANYTIRGHYMIVQQLFKKAELRIGSRKVFVIKEKDHG
ncbi:TrbG/VirB9 family P-type conjugative transfer protein [Acidithiobacillus ferrooxidans]|uniref:TrbG/VirB9 family P-type conjugative transfer protein n=1 Tax=Acidithiobacillus ferrooxidans TaxID=920 RepID=UPI0013D34C5E|nr:TrbG/VirB9 family P-type conjugative transfer protein [Acidithiobacillus ferrooxidans]